MAISRSYFENNIGYCMAFVLFKRTENRLIASMPGSDEGRTGQPRRLQCPQADIVQLKAASYYPNHIKDIKGRLQR